MSSEKWWRERVIYQIYPMSFCDSDGDGIGDLNGIISKLDYLKNLGVGAIWLSPVYSSPNRDNGYDISDYKNIHENYGTMEDMDNLIEQCKELDIKVIMDLVINHTSDKHEWFEKSRLKIEPYTDYYIWKEGKEGEKPSNWGSFFGEDCWNYDEERKEYYLHLFAKEQPDLNYNNEAVVKEVMDVMRFWLDKGVDGFRCDVINILHKNSLENGKKRLALTGLEHYLSTEGTHKLLNRFNEEVFEKYNCYTVGETVFVNTKAAKLLTDEDRKELSAVFSFEHMETDCFGVKWIPRKFSAHRFLSTLSKWQRSMDFNTVYFENHDQPRSVSRFGNDKKYRIRSAKALAILLLSLRGTPFMFEGQEIGMTNFDFKDIDSVKDVESNNIWAKYGSLHVPKFLRWQVIKDKSRDNARTPMQWTDEEHGGFTTGTPWLGVNKNYKRINVQAQDIDNNSILNFYRRLIAYRNESEALQSGEYRRMYLKGGVLMFERKTDTRSLKVIVNLTGKSKKSPITGEAVFSSCKDAYVKNILRPYEAAIIENYSTLVL